ncbi:hypothetical protein QR685DRAFT_138971 [Neurospora intermedia]|uniref:Secreted protein n=1 Tax=Neurospora intermedia TaxID=5142 RepID=A0ABR3CY67_NEUIN
MVARFFLFSADLAFFSFSLSALSVMRWALSGVYRAKSRPREDNSRQLVTSTKYDGPAFQKRALRRSGYEKGRGCTLEYLAWTSLVPQCTFLSSLPISDHRPGTIEQETTCTAIPLGLRRTFCSPSPLSVATFGCYLHHLSPPAYPLGSVHGTPVLLANDRGQRPPPWLMLSVAVPNASSIPEK